MKISPFSIFLELGDTFRACTRELMGSSQISWETRAQQRSGGLDLFPYFIKNCCFYLKDIWHAIILDACSE